MHIYPLRKDNLLIVAFQISGFVVASGLALVGAVIQSIFLWQSLVKWVSPGDLVALFF